MVHTGIPKVTFRTLHAGLGLHASIFDGSKQRCMVALGLVGIGLGKGGNRLVECISIAEIASDLR